MTKSQDAKPADPVETKPAVAPPPKAPTLPSQVGTAQKKSDAILELQKVFAKLTEADRDSLARAGVNVPRGDLAALTQGKFKFGLRCSKCNEIALFFIGDKWVMRGQEYDAPPAIPHWEIAWSQDRPVAEIDRHEPTCQHCGVVVPRQQNGAFDYGNVLRNSETTTGRSRLVVIDEFRASRDAAFDRRNVREFAKKRDRGSATADTHGISHDYINKPRKPSEVMDEKLGEGTSERLNAVAEQVGLNELQVSRG